METKIIKTVCSHYGVRPQQLKIPSKRKYSTPRQIIWYFLHEDCKMILWDISSIFYNKQIDTSKVAQGIKSVRRILEVDRVFVREIEGLRERISNTN